MDIKLSNVRAVYFFVVFALFVVTTPAAHKSRGTSRFTSRQHNRREVRDYLAPPSQDASYTSYGPPSLQPPPFAPYRPGRHLNPPPPPPPPPSSTEEPGYFARLASWLNPFGESPTPPPFPQISVPSYIAKYSPSHVSHSYGPPPSSSASRDSYSPPVPQPQPPPAGPNGYLPPNGKGKNCNPCNIVPWNPLPGLVRSNAYSSGATDIEIQPSISQEGKDNGAGIAFGYSDEVRTPDFSHGLPLSPHQGQHPSYPGFSPHGNPPLAPIPYPHLYPGPMPPLFKARPFSPSIETFRPTPSVELESGQPEHIVDSVLSVTGPGTPDPIDGHVEVLPPGAEVDTSGASAIPPSGYASEIHDSPPPGYQENHNNGHGSATLSIEQSTAIHEQHLSTELTAGYKIKEPGNFEITKSIPAAEYPASVEHPIHYEQSPLIDLSNNNNQKPSDGSESQSIGDDYAAGLNPPPPPGDSDSSYGSTSDKSKDASYGGESPDNFQVFTSVQAQKSSGDSSVASTVNNGSLSHPTPTYGIPDIGILPVSHEETTKPPVYEAFPPSTEKFLISVKDSTKSTKAYDASSSQDQETLRGNGNVVDSYQHQVNPSVVGHDNHDAGQSSFIKNPEPLVPYRPSSLYVPYPPYSGPSIQPQEGSSSLEDSGPTTEEPFLDALLKSYNNFKQEMDANDQILREHQSRLRAESQQNNGQVVSGGTTWISQPQPSFSSPEKINPSVYASGNGNGNSGTQKPQSGVKKNKQVQIIIPYTSQYTPGPFRPVNDDWSGRGPLEQTQARKVPAVESPDHNYIGEESKSVEITRPLRPLENLLINELAEKPKTKQTNNSIDVSRLQKNIDNWTIQEYSRGITSSTALPSSSHPYLLPSKKIPNEYLTSTQSSSTEENSNKNRSDLPGLNYNDLEHEGAASSRVDVPHIQVLRIEGVSKPVEYESKFPTSTESSSTKVTPASYSTSSSTSTSTEASWAELPVSISPHNNERVYVVTPQPERTEKSWPKLNDKKNGVIEKAYQVLPQAVNNLASTSVIGPDVSSPLWGIMEHDKYARSDQENSSSNPPILYSGHSKVSNARQ